ncbi:hypothetical protein, partial [uncultured Thiodictyon sp.]|uniref:hypothetical protein n=1 Tax=uncultured Thiodictyon sp. TaxID=1846217 RepID=UPI0025E6E11A
MACGRIRGATITSITTTTTTTTTTRRPFPNGPLICEVDRLTVMAPAPPRNMKVRSTASSMASVRGGVVRASSPDCSSPDTVRPGWPDYAPSR